MKRKVLSVILTGAMVAGLAGTVTVHAEEQKTYNIGICQLVQHEALDAATQGFEDAVKEGLGEENVTLMSRMHRVIPQHVVRSSTTSYPVT